MALILAAVIAVGAWLVGSIALAFFVGAVISIRDKRK